MSVKVISSYSFDYSIDDAKLIQIEFNDIKETTNNTDKFQWYLIRDNRRLDLSFYKILENGSKYFKLNRNEYIIVDTNNNNIEIGVENKYSHKYKLINLQ
jgi:hypothetical protein